MMSNGEIAKRTLVDLEAQDRYLEELTEKARIDRVAYQLALENLLTLRQLENGVIIRWDDTK